VIWTVNNLLVTLLNKACFTALVSFPYPYTLTAIHMAVCAFCCHSIFYSIGAAARKQQQQQSNNNNTTKNLWVQLLGDQLQHPIPTLDAHGQRLIAAFSVLFSLNIAMGNVSLHYVSVNFNQVLRSLVPVVTLWLTLCRSTTTSSSTLRKKQQPISAARQRAVGPVVAGVALACAGDRSAVTVAGWVSTLLCVVLASLKVVASSELLTTGCGGANGMKQLHPVVLLQLLAPLAMVQCLVLALATGELGEIGRRWDAEFNPWTTGDGTPCAVLLFSGLLAFSLNISALQAYKLTSPLTCCIAAAVKQVLMIVVSTAMFQTPVSLMNGTGIVVVLVASAYYSLLSVQEQAQQAKDEKNAEVDVECSVTAKDKDESESESMALLVVDDVCERQQEDAVQIVSLQDDDDEPSRKMGVVSRWFRSRSNEGAV